MTYEEVTDQLNDLRVIIGDAIVFFSVWQELMVPDEQSALALNRYRGLFVPARAAMLRMAIMQVAKVFDHHHKAVSLRNLLKAVKSDPETLVPFVPSEELDQIEKQMDSNEGLLNRVKAFRDQRIAHHDAVASNDMSVRFGEARRLTEEVQSMYNALRRGHDRNITSFDGMANDAKNHTAAVVQIMREEMERSLQAIKEAERRVAEEMKASGVMPI